MKLASQLSVDWHANLNAVHYHAVSCHSPESGDSAKKFASILTLESKCSIVYQIGPAIPAIAIVTLQEMDF